MENLYVNWIHATKKESEDIQRNKEHFELGKNMKVFWKSEERKFCNREFIGDMSQAATKSSRLRDLDLT